MFIDYSRQERVNKILTLPEWINMVKQLGMMHLLYHTSQENATTSPDRSMVHMEALTDYQRTGSYSCTKQQTAREN